MCSGYGRSVNPRPARADVPAKVHPQRAADGESDGNQLGCCHPAPEQEPVVLRPEELDDETLDSGKNTVHAEQPPLRMLVIAEPPENEEHHETESNFVKLGRMHGNDLVLRRTRGKLHSEHARQVAYGRRRRALGEHRRPRTVKRAAVVITNRPAACSSNRVARAQSSCSDVADPREAQLLLAHHERGGKDAADQSAPENKTSPAQD